MSNLDEDDLFNLSDVDEEGVEAAGGDNSDVTAEIDSFLAEDENEGEISKIEAEKKSKIEAADKAKIEANEKSKNEAGQAKNETENNKSKMEVEKVEINFRPQMQSTPVTATRHSSRVVMSTIPEEDYSILYDNDDVVDEYDFHDEDGFETVDMDKLAQTYDLSILEEEEEQQEEQEEEEEEEVVDSSLNNTTVVENVVKITEKAKETLEEPVVVVEAVKEEADSTIKEDLGTKKTTTGAAAKKAKDSNTLVASCGRMAEKQTMLIMKKYYDKAKQNWIKTTDLAAGFQIPDVNDPRLQKPLFWRDDKTGKFKVEGQDEWADKYHPMWEEWRFRTQDDNKIGAYIHHKWNWKTSIDISRNLTKFSKRSPLANTAAAAIAATNKAVKSSTNCQQKLAAVVKKGGGPDSTSIDDESSNLLDGKNIFKELIKRLDDETENESCLVESSDQPVITSKAAETSTTTGEKATKVNRAGCQFCTVFCHCSPGRRQKRPYLAESANVIIDPDVPPEKQLCLQDVYVEVHETISGQVISKKKLSKNYGYYSKSAANVIASTNEAFELAGNYRQNIQERTYFSREQVRELLSVEIAQDKYRSIYNSPYAGGGGESSDIDEDSEHDEIGDITTAAVKNSDDSDEVWSKSQLEDY